MQRHPDNLTVFGINTDASPEMFRTQCERFGVTWPNVFVGDGALPTDWGIDSYPTMFLLDREGVVRHVNPRGEALERAVDELIAEK